VSLPFFLPDYVSDRLKLTGLRHAGTPITRRPIEALPLPSLVLEDPEALGIPLYFLHFVQRWVPLP